jgi:hypothetical protein
VKWQPFRYEGTDYDLSHLDPCAIQFERPAKNEKPATTFNVDVTFSLHCFAKEISRSEPHDATLEYADARETRLFDFQRYEMSKRLPDLIRDLAKRKCVQTGHSNFLTIDLTDNGGNKVEYDVFFSVSRSSQKGRLNLFVQSAYVRDDPRNRPPSGKPIGFLIVLHNVLNKRPIRP